ncbi:MAG: hypothetical protein JSS86_12305 [Cyanobacteria bacterium SZAS LIN-2]|nr:hypothetical protein [Cyanobacteria bacterium SZAS LIN-3]MBS1997092.1 hypothetical protein [Cyanobacteria bacterium SZAS LIN-2]
MHHFDALTISLMAIAYGLYLVGSLWLILVTFQKSLGWGLACLFVPFASLVFVCKNWDRASKPVFCCLISSAIGITLYASNPSFHEAYDKKHSPTTTIAQAAKPVKPVAPAVHKTVHTTTNHSGIKHHK